MLFKKIDLHHPSEEIDSDVYVSHDTTILQDVFAQHDAQALKAHICTEVNLITRVDKLHAKTFMMAKVQLAGQLEWGTHVALFRNRPWHQSVTSAQAGL